MDTNIHYDHYYRIPSPSPRDPTALKKALRSWEVPAEEEHHQAMQEVLKTVLAE